MANAGMRVDIDNVDKIVDRISKGTGRQILVGIPDGSTRRDTPASNAMIGYVQEFGSPAQNIPARPFMVPSLQQKKDDIAKLLKDALALDNQSDTSVDQAYQQIGLKAVAIIKNYMQTHAFPALSEATLQRRRTRANEPNNRTNPLLDTLQLFNAITYVVVNKGGGNKTLPKSAPPKELGSESSGMGIPKLPEGLPPVGVL